MLLIKNIRSETSFNLAYLSDNRNCINFLLNHPRSKNVEKTMNKNLLIIKNTFLYVILNNNIIIYYEKKKY